MITQSGHLDLDPLQTLTQPSTKQLILTPPQNLRFLHRSDCHLQPYIPPHNKFLQPPTTSSHRGLGDGGRQVDKWVGITPHHTGSDMLSSHYYCTFSSDKLSSQYCVYFNTINLTFSQRHSTVDHSPIDLQQPTPITKVQAHESTWSGQKVNHP